MNPAADHRNTFVVEHYWPGVALEQFRAAADRVRESAEDFRSTAAPIRFLHSTLVPDDEAAFCVFAAASRAVVEEVYRRAGVSFERIIAAVEIAASDSRDGGTR